MIMEYNYEIENLENMETKVSITIPQKEIKSKHKELITHLGKNIQLPGFRKGKVPASVVEKKFGNDIKGQILEDCYSHTIKEIAPKLQWLVGPKNLDVVDGAEKISPDKPLIMELIFIGPPKLTLGEYKNLELNQTEYQYSKDDVKHYLDKMREQKADLEELDKGKVEKDMLVSFVYNIYLIDRQEENDKNMRIQIGQTNPPYDEFEKFLKGMKLYEEKTYPYTVPDWYEEEGMRGKNGNIYVKVIKLEKRILPELDDEFAKDNDFDTLDEMKKDIEEKIKKYAEDESRRKNIEAIMDQIVENSQFEIPEELLENYFEAKLNERSQKMGMDLVSMYKQGGFEESKEILSFFDDIKKETEESIKVELVYESILDKEKLMPEEQSIEEEIKKMKDELFPYATGEGEDKINIDELLKNERIKESMKHAVLNRKVEDFLLENQKYKKKEKEKLPLS